MRFFAAIVGALLTSSIVNAVMWNRNSVGINMTTNTFNTFGTVQDFSVALQSGTDSSGTLFSLSPEPVPHLTTRYVGSSSFSSAKSNPSFSSNTFSVYLVGPMSYSDTGAFSLSTSSILGAGMFLRYTGTAYTFTASLSFQGPCYYASTTTKNWTDSTYGSTVMEADYTGPLYTMKSRWADGKYMMNGTTYYPGAVKTDIGVNASSFGYINLTDYSISTAAYAGYFSMFGFLTYTSDVSNYTDRHMTNDNVTAMAAAAGTTANLAPDVSVGSNLYLNYARTATIWMYDGTSTTVNVSLAVYDAATIAAASASFSASLTALSLVLAAHPDSINSALDARIAAGNYAFWVASFPGVPIASISWIEWDPETGASTTVSTSSSTSSSSTSSPTGNAAPLATISVAIAALIAVFLSFVFIL